MTDIDIDWRYVYRCSVFDRLPDPERDRVLDYLLELDWIDDIDILGADFDDEIDYVQSAYTRLRMKLWRMNGLDL